MMSERVMVLSKGTFFAVGHSKKVVAVENAVVYFTNIGFHFLAFFFDQQFFVPLVPHVLRSPEKISGGT